MLRHQLEQDAFPVFMVSGKRTHDAKKVFDGVLSLLWTPLAMVAQ